MSASIGEQAHYEVLSNVIKCPCRSQSAASNCLDLFTLGTCMRCNAFVKIKRLLQEIAPALGGPRDWRASQMRLMMSALISEKIQHNQDYGFYGNLPTLIYLE